MGLLDEFMLLRSRLDGVEKAVGRHERVPESRWGTVTAITPAIRVSVPGDGEYIITRTTEDVIVGDAVRLHVQGRDRWIVGLVPRSRVLTGASDFDAFILDGSYSWTGTPAHAPTAATAPGWLEVLSPNGVTQQRASDSSGRSWSRTLSGGVWSAWISPGWVDVGITWPSYFASYGSGQQSTLLALGKQRMLTSGVFFLNAGWAANTAYTVASVGPAAADRPVNSVETGVTLRWNANTLGIGILQIQTTFAGGITWFSNIAGSANAAIVIPTTTWTVA